MKKQAKFNIILVLFLLFALAICSCQKSNISPTQKTVTIDSTIFHLWTLDSIIQYNGVIVLKSAPFNVKWDVQASQTCITENTRATACYSSILTYTTLAIYYFPVKPNTLYRIVGTITPTSLILQETNLNQRIIYQFSR